jgi:hypothetical protein
MEWVWIVLGASAVLWAISRDQKQLSTEHLLDRKALRDELIAIREEFKALRPDLKPGGPVADIAMQLEGLEQCLVHLGEDVFAIRALLERAEAITRTEESR